MAMQHNTRRIFLALPIEVDEDFKNSLSAIRASFSAEKMRWIDPSNYHLTLRFIGPMKDSEISALLSVLENYPDFPEGNQVNIIGLGIFKSPYKARVLWMGTDGNQVLRNLKNHVDLALGRMGWKFETREFSPHVSLARMKVILDTLNLQSVLEEYKQNLFQKVFLTKFCVYESILSARMAEYRVLKEIKLPSP